MHRTILRTQYYMPKVPASSVASRSLPVRRTSAIVLGGVSGVEHNRRSRKLFSLLEAPSTMLRCTGRPVSSLSGSLPLCTAVRAFVSSSSSFSSATECPREENTIALANVLAGQSPLAAAYAASFWRLLEDRRVCYRDGVALEKLLPSRQALSETLRHGAFASSLARLPPSSTLKHNSPSLTSGGSSGNEAANLVSQLDEPPLIALLRALEAEAMALSGEQGDRCQDLSQDSTHKEHHPSVSLSANAMAGDPRMAFLHQHLLLSDLLRSTDDLALVVRHVLRDQGVSTSGPAEMESSRSRNAVGNTLSWQPMLFTCILQALMPLTMTTTTSTTTTTVFGEQKQLERERLGELCGVYMGQALKAFHAYYCGRSTAAQREEMDTVWSAFFVDACAAQMSPKLLDLWWGKMLEFYAAGGENKDVATAQKSSASDVTHPSTGGLPYEAVYGLLSATADNMDIERTLQIFHEANKRGLRVLDRHGGACETAAPVAATTTAPHHYNNSDGWRYASVYHAPGFLTRHSEDLRIQEVQLRLLAKLMAAAKSSRADGGLRELVVRDLQRLTSPEVLMAAPWEVVNDILSGLSVPSAMHLVKARSASESTRHKTAAAQGDEAQAKEKKKKKKNAMIHSSGSDNSEGDDSKVPFFIWASLLRRCARDHQLDEAEALFTFIRQQFSLLTVVERHELVSIMMRMYATLSPPDAPSTLHLFLRHVLQPAAAQPDRTDLITPDDQLYSLLVKSADSRNASMMYFLEGCAAGVSMSPDMFEALMGGSAHASVRALNKRLPQEYTSSKLDTLLRIPSNIDAHLRREEAQAARGKPIVDSTGDPI